ncbi:MAG: alanine--tRNA ligase [Alphaproteobacteria bacterium]|jgi:alanyl-tRNA synthetase|nr:alanine--tRNA ligase [Alphaproteobacteria bacterium]
MIALNDIRTTFLDYFAKAGHEVVSSSPLVPRNDPTLMFVNAGMVQFKNVFTGAEKRPYSRAASSQKCVRAGGKHNDLDNVGYTARHHTFFEMLGNFSFGDYFKDVAIELAWTLITKEFQLDTKRLLVTVYSEDDEAAALWKKIAGFPDSKIIRIPTSDNFWSMGETGPCGPCSEIFYDYGDKVQGGPPGSPDQDGDRFVEFWNLVFMQFDQVTKDKRVSLPKPSIDTGMGLERIASILQGQTDNYDTDLFRRLIDASATLTGQHANGAHAASHRVISDHLRASSFLIADGVLPSNEGRGYVLRRIMRRAMRHAHILGAKDPLMYRLVPVLVGEMAAAYPELTRAQALIVETLKLEETKFRQTLERGLKLLDEATANMGSAKTLSGDVAFKLYDTFGFPYDLTEDALRAKGIGVDRAGFDAAMAKQKADARAAWAGSGEAATETVWFELREKVGATEFLGYDTETAEGIVTAIVKGGQPVDQLGAGDAGQVLVNQTPFYGESGGQVGDEGAMFTKNGAEFAVEDTLKKLGDVHVHVGKLSHGTLKVGDVVDLRVDNVRRTATRANHSATHLLHEALRRVLGPHVTQKGSLVAPDKLRFDFSHNKALSEAEIAAIETLVNDKVRANEDVSTRLMTPEKAVAEGAMALFGEKYGEEVRVLSMGSDDGKTYSVELCGGTHVRRLGDIGLMKIVGESAVAAGVRRIEALTGAGALAYLNEQHRLVREAASAMRAAPAELPERISQLLDERKKLERELGDARRQLAMGGGSGGAAASEAVDIGGVKVMARIVEGVEPKDLRSLVDQAKQQITSGVVALATTSDGKAAMAVGVTEDLAKRFNAVELLKRGVEAVGGKGGGGRPDMAQGGGPEGTKLQAALDAITAAIKAAA